MYACTLDLGPGLDQGQVPVDADAATAGFYLQPRAVLCACIWLLHATGHHPALRLPLGL